MKSILEGRPALSSEVEKIAEVAGYLWQNGWAERNGGNITVNVTEYADEEMKAMPAISGSQGMLLLLQGNGKENARPGKTPNGKRKHNTHS